MLVSDQLLQRINFHESVVYGIVLAEMLMQPISDSGRPPSREIFEKLNDVVYLVPVGVVEVFII